MLAATASQERMAVHTGSLAYLRLCVHVCKFRDGGKGERGEEKEREGDFDLSMFIRPWNTLRPRIYNIQLTIQE